MLRRGLVLVGWFGGLAGVLVALHVAPLAVPDATAPATWASWAEERTPAEAAMGVLRLVGIGLAWYLLAASLLGVAAAVVGGARAVELADVVTLPFVRRVVQAGLGIGFAGAVVAAAGARGHVPVEPGPTAADVALATEPSNPVHERNEELPLVHPVREVTPTPPPARMPTTRVLVAGDHLWSVAEDVLREALGREPEEREVHPYWQRLVEVNRPRLPVPGNPDLVFDGMEIEVPSAG